MFWSKSSFSVIPSVILSLLVFVLAGMLVSCGNLPENLPKFGNKPQETVILDADYQPVATAKLAEVAPPVVIKELSKSLDQYNPQVRILSPQPNQLLPDTTVNVTLDVQDYPLFKDETLDMGPHLHLIVDNEPYIAIYDVNKPFTLENLAPGTHTLRVFASRPWHESFKNEGAYAQTTFHVFTKTNDNSPDPNLPLLTYSRPKGNYGAEPFLLDFYLTNAPLHIYSPEGEDLNPMADWRIRVTINGESFLLDRWQPIYLKGLEKGGNWVKLEFLDADGNPVKNVFNDTARLITYTPDETDTLSKLVRGELSAESARAIVSKDAPIPPIPTVTPIIEPELEETPEEIETPLENEEVSETETEETLQPIEETVISPVLEETDDLNTEKELTEEKAEIIPTSEEIKQEMPEKVVIPEVTPQPSPVEVTKTDSNSSEIVSKSEPIPNEMQNLSATELQLKILESIEELEQKLDNLPKNSLKTEVAQEFSPPNKGNEGNVENLRNELKNRLQNWRELLNFSS